MKKEVKNQTINGKQFKDYIISKSLGEGTFGKVKLGIHKITNEKVAIKILQKSRINDLADTQRVTRQIHILKLVRHPNIVQLYEILQTNKKLFLIMQYMQNGELFEYIVKNKRLKQQQACRLFHQLIDGLQYIHKINVAHRDLKPQNILLDYRNNIRIVDFGLSNTYKKNEKLKTACGSPCYAAPQMLKGQQYQGINVDIWSAGVILFAMVCGYLPFQDNKDQAELYRRIMQADYNINVSLSESLKDLIRKILTVNPQYRYKIDQIRKHPWMTMNYNNNNNINNNNNNNSVSNNVGYQNYRRNSSCKGIVVGYNKIPIDMKILHSLSDYDKDIDIQKTQSCLQANRHTNLTTTYYLALKKYIKQGGDSVCDFNSKNFDKSLLQPILSNNRRDQNSKTHMVLIQNFITAQNSDNANINMRKKSKQKIKEKLDKSKQKERDKQNRQPNIDKSKQNIHPQKSSMVQIKKSRTNSKVTRLDPKIQNSINYGRPSTTKSTQKISVKRQSQFENRINRKYKQKFNQSLISKSRDKIYHNNNNINNISIHQQQNQSYHQPLSYHNNSNNFHNNTNMNISITNNNNNHNNHNNHNKSRLDNSVTKITTKNIENRYNNENRNQTYQISQVMQSLSNNARKRTNSKKTCGQVINIKSDMIKHTKGRWM